MAKKLDWSNEDAVAMREFLRKVPEDKIREVMDKKCPALLTSDVLLKESDAGIARLAAMKAGWDAYHEALFGAAAKQPTTPQPGPDFRDMT